MRSLWTWLFCMVVFRASYNAASVTHHRRKLHHPVDSSPNYQDIKAKAMPLKIPVVVQELDVIETIVPRGSSEETDEYVKPTTFSQAAIEKEVSANADDANVNPNEGNDEQGLPPPPQPESVDVECSRPAEREKGPTRGLFNRDLLNEEKATTGPFGWVYPPEAKIIVPMKTLELDTSHLGRPTIEIVEIAPSRDLLRNALGDSALFLQKRLRSLLRRQRYAVPAEPLEPDVAPLKDATAAVATNADGVEAKIVSDEKENAPAPTPSDSSFLKALSSPLGYVRHLMGCDSEEHPTTMPGATGAIGAGGVPPSTKDGGWSPRSSIPSNPNNVPGQSPSVGGMPTAIRPPTVGAPGAIGSPQALGSPQPGLGAPQQPVTGGQPTASSWNIGQQAAPGMNAGQPPVAGVGAPVAFNTRDEGSVSYF